MNIFSIACDILGIVAFTTLAFVHHARSNEDAVCGFICAAMWALSSLLSDVAR